MGRRTWIKIFTDKWLRGTLREETSEVRGIWVDILTLAGDSAFGDEGCIKLAKDVGYTDEQIAAILHIGDMQKWVDAKKKLTDTNRIEVLTNNVVRIINWNKYQSEYSRQKVYRKGYKQGLHKKVTISHSPSPSPSPSISLSPSLSKEKYKEYVYLTKEEHRKLIEMLGQATFDNLIENLNNYVGSTGKRYKSHYHTILAWARKDIVKPTEAQKRTAASFKRLDKMLEEDEHSNI